MAHRRHTALLLAAIAWFAGSAVISSADAQATSLQTGLIPAFPFCGCASRTGAYTVSPITAHGDGKFCFRIIARSCDRPCCKADLRKIELNINSECIMQPRPSVRSTINGAPTRVGPGFGRPRDAPPGGAILRLTQLGLNLTTAAGAEVCITLRPNRLGQGCTTLESLCKPPAGAPAGVCSIAMFDTSNKCCPLTTSRVAYPPSIPIENAFRESPPPDMPPPATPQPSNPPPLLPSPPPPSPPSPAPPSPPSPPPPSPPPPCPSCIYLRLALPAIDVAPYRFSPAACASIQTMMASQLNERAVSAAGTGASQPLRRNYTVDSTLCEPLQVGVCGEFFSAADGAALAAWADQQAAVWLAAVAGSGSACSAALDGYSLSVSSRGGACPFVNKSLSCSTPVNPFPSCKCNRTRGTTPYTVSPYTAVERGRTATTVLYCFTINVLGADKVVPSTCGTSDGLHKMEFWADDTRNRAITGIQLRPAVGPSSWISPTWGAKGEMALKATPLNWSLGQANGGKVCLELLRTVPLGDFCMGPAPDQCFVGFFNDNRKCCPIYRTEVRSS